MISICPFSISLLINISMYSVIAAMLNSGFTIALNSNKSLKERIEEKDAQSGLCYQPEKHIKQLKSCDHHKRFIRNIKLFAAILITYLLIILIYNFLPQIANAYNVVIDFKRGFKIVFAQQNVSSNLAIGIADYVGYQFTISKLFMLLAVILSWVEIITITAFYYLTIRTTCFYALLLK